MTLKALAAALLLAVASGLVQAGNPPHCEKPVCGMKSCISFKNGKPQDAVCSNNCSKQCCRCSKTCHRQ